METKQQTIVVAGVEWAAENLKGYGGTEIDGRWYYTWDQFLEAWDELWDQGWTLPRADDFVKLDQAGLDPELSGLQQYGSEWDGERQGRVFAGGLFLPADGILQEGELKEKDTEGFYWTDDDRERGCVGCMFFGKDGINERSAAKREDALSVRLIRRSK